MLINEIFNTVVDINWKYHDGKRTGPFKLGELIYTIKADDWQISIPTPTGEKVLDFMDVGFTAGDNIQTLEPTKLYKGAKVFGAFVNGIKPIIAKVQPSVILFGARKKDEFFESRLSLYKRLADTYMKHSSYQYMIDGLETPKGSFVLLSKVKLTKEDVQFIKTFIADNFSNKD